MRVLWGLLLVASAGCLQSGAVLCDDGRTCPPNTTCDAVHGGCISAAQTDACAGKADGDTCTYDTQSGLCDRGVCLTAICGNGIVEPSEVCDDENLESGDGCRGDCASDETCGNGVLDVQVGESCDCGTSASLGAPAAGCVEFNSSILEAAECREDCQLRCGDGVIERGEYCEASPAPQDSCFTFGYDHGSIGCNTLSCQPDVSDCEHLVWRQVMLGSLSDIWVAGFNDVFAVGPSGTDGVLKRYDGSIELAVPVPEPMNAVSGSARDNVFAVGNAGSIWRFDGSTWTETPSGTTERLHGVWVASASDAWAVGDNATLLRWNGSNWSSVTHGLTTWQLYGVWGTGPSDVFAVGGHMGNGAEGVIMHFDGNTWSLMTYPGGGTAWYLRAVWGTSGTDVFAVGNVGTILHYNGVAWSRMTSGITSELLDVGGRGSEEVYAVGLGGADNPTMLRYDGTAWQRTATLNPVQAYSVFGSGRELYGTSFSGAYRAATSLWDRVPNPNPNIDPTCADPTSLSGLAVVAPNDAYAFADGKLYHFDGIRWGCTEDATFEARNDSFVFPDGDIVAVGGQTILTRTSGTWAVATPTLPSGTTLSSVWGASPSDVFVAGSNGVILRGAGTTWTPQTLPTGTRTVSRIDGRSASDVYATVIGSPADVLHFNGSDWTALPGVTFALPAALHDLALTPQAVYVYRASLHRYAAGAWTTLPAFVPMPGFGVFTPIIAFAEDDIFIGGNDTSGNALLNHWDGTRFDPVRIQGEAITRLTGVRRKVFAMGQIGGGPQLQVLERSTAWTCTTTETECSDGLDGDCDSLGDANDPDCP